MVGNEESAKMIPMNFVVAPSVKEQVSKEVKKENYHSIGHFLRTLINEYFSSK